MADTNLFWESFQKLNEEPDTPIATTPVSVGVLSDFGISYTNSKGGTLNGVDIKRADALSVLKASLLEEYASGSTTRLIEVCINADGEAEFYEVGASTSSINPYYTIPSSNIVKPKASVMVTGKKPKQERIVPSTSWIPLIGPDADCTIWDTKNLSTSCISSVFSTHATITYKDPFRHNPNTSYNDGVPDIFELQSPFERFIGLTWRITPPADKVTIYTKIYKQSQSSIPVLLSNHTYRLGDKENFPFLGTPKKRANRTDANTRDCKQYEGDNVEVYCSDDTVPINLSGMKEYMTYELAREVDGTRKQISKFLGVQGVFILGVPLQPCYGVASPGKQKLDNTSENTSLFIGAVKPFISLFRLNEGIHYTILYPEEIKDDPTSASIPCIQFANNLRQADNAKIGTGVDFFVDVTCKDLQTLVKADTSNFNGKGSVLPLENGGVLVNQIWAQITLDTPSFLVLDPSGAALAVAEKLTVEVLPLILKDEPSPIAINGVLIDQRDSVQDNDPTKQQDLQNTELELAYSEMSSGRTMSLSFASLDETQIVTLSRKLQNLLEEDRGATYTHTCPPTDTPILGAKGIKGGIINVIEYSYTDQGSYLITVMEGPEYFGDFAGIDGGIYYRKTEEVTTQGTIVADAGNHIQYKVHIDGIGSMDCINGCAQVLSVRDRVSITIHNNAVES